MSTSNRAIKAKLNELIDLLPVKEINTVESYLNFLLYKYSSPKLKNTGSQNDDFVSFLEKSPVDKPLTIKEQKSLSESRDQIKNGKFITLSQFRDRRKKA
jgi:hypothetical protein